MDTDRSRNQQLNGRQQRRVVRSGIGSCAAFLLLIAVAAGCDSGTDAGAATVPYSSAVSTTAGVATTVNTTSTLVAAATAPATTVPETSITIAEAAPSTTTVLETTTTIAPAPVATVAAAPPESAPPASVAPAVAVAPSTAARNCTDAGTISIASINVAQPILAEATAFADGLLCGNHRSDGVTQGVDILPGYASVEASALGGQALVGRVPAVIFGHRKSHNRPFFNIDKLHAGDIVAIHRPDGTELDLQVATVQLHAVGEATNLLFAPSADGAPQVRLVACAHADGTPGGINYRWIATLVPV